MSASIPAKLRDAQTVQFAKRAAQLEKFRPIITYWLRFFITQKIINKGLHLADQECTLYTTDLMGRLEQTKADHPTEDALLDEVAAQAYCEQFALQTFSKGDNEIRANKVNAQTADTLQAASTFLELLSVWKPEPDQETKDKMKFAKYHAARILKAIKAGEDPNLSNPPRQETPVASPAVLDPNDPEVRRIHDGTQPAVPAQNPYQSYAESAPNTSAQTSPTFAAQGASPPATLPSAPTGYSQAPPPPTFPQHEDVSPISQPANSRHGSVASVGGGYFPRVDVPTFTADNAAPSLSTAPSMEDEPMTSPYETSPAPQAPQLPQPPQAPDPQSFYQTQAPAPPFQQPPPVSQPTQQSPHPQPLFHPQQSGYASGPPIQSPQQHSNFQPSSTPPQQHKPYSQQQPQLSQPQTLPQAFSQPIPVALQSSQNGSFRTDDESILEAQKQAKWAVSALNFEDVDTAVKYLRTALRALGTS